MDMWPSLPQFLQYTFVILGPPLTEDLNEEHVEPFDAGLVGAESPDDLF